MIIQGGTYNSGVYRSAPGIPTSNLVVYLDAGNPASYNATSPTFWYDLSGQGNTAYLNTGITYYPDNGGILGFNGAGDGYAQIGAGFGYNYSAGLTVNIWADFAAGGGGWERLIDFGNGPGGPTGYNLIMCNNGNGLGYLLMSIDAVNDDVATPDGLIPGEAPITFNGWAMYTMYCDGTNWKQYKNGQYYSSEAISSVPATVTRVRNYIGRSNWDSDPFFTGNMSVITMYNRALSDAEILQTYNAFKGRYGL